MNILRDQAKRLIDEMPEVGLDEAVESLTFMCDFWLEREAYKPPPEPKPVYIRGRIGETRIRPSFHLDEDHL